MTSELCTRVCLHEGFSAKPYQDSLSIWTIGHGLTWISIEESEHIVEGRLKSIAESLLYAKEWFLDLPEVVRDVLVEMSFQMGVQGCLKFKRMWLHLEENRFWRAADEMLDSKWAKQTPGRAESLAEIMRHTVAV